MLLAWTQFLVSIRRLYSLSATPLNCGVFFYHLTFRPASNRSLTLSARCPSSHFQPWAITSWQLRAVRNFLVCLDVLNRGLHRNASRHRAENVPEWSGLGSNVVNLRLDVRLSGHPPPAPATTYVSPVDLGVPRGAENMDSDVWYPDSDVWYPDF